MPHESKDVSFVFFGTSPVAVGVLEVLKREGYLPSVIVTTPDAPAGRKLELTPPPAKIWAIKNKIPILQPQKLNAEFIYQLKTKNYELFLVASYGLLIPRRVLELPKHGVLNVHPSLLPKYRGPSPIQTAILNGDTETGVDIMLMDEKMDEGPIIAEERVALDGTEKNEELEVRLATIGGKLLAKVLPGWIDGKITLRPQDHVQATYTRKFEKIDGFIDPIVLEPVRFHLAEDFTLREQAEEAERKVRALGNTPGTYTILKTKNGKDMRVKILSAKIDRDRLMPTKVIPEGKREITWDEFKRGYF